MAGLDALAVGGGVTDPRDARHASGGLLAVQGPTALDIRTGVLAGPGSAALITGTADVGQMTVQIALHVAVGSRGTANGPYLGPTLDAATKVNVVAAPASGSRIDVVYVKQQDTTSGVPSPDAAAGPLYGVLAGQASTSTPVKPDLTTIVGATELGTVTVAAGATSTNGSGVTIANTARQTVARGAPIPVRSQADRDALTLFVGLQVSRLDLDGDVQTYGANGWRDTRTLVYNAPAYTSNAVSGATNILTSVAIPDRGVRYTLVVDARQDVLVSPGSNWNLTTRIDTIGGTLVLPVGAATSTAYTMTSIIGGSSGVLTGAHTVLFCAERQSTTAGDGYQVNPVANLQSYRVQVIPA